MEKMSQRKLDSMLKYVDKLKEHGILKSVSIKEISKVFDVSQKNTKQIVNYFKKTGIVKFQCALNYEKLGVFTVLIIIKSLHPKYNEEITKELSKIKYIRGIYLLTGMEITHLLRARTPSIGELIDLIETNLRDLQDKIEWTQTMIVFKIYFDDGHFKDPPILKGQYANLPALGKKDWQILAILKYNSTTKLKEIANKIGLTIPATHRRIKNLIKQNIIFGYYSARQWEDIDKIYAQTPVRVICTFRVRSPFEKKIVNRLKQYSKKGHFQLSWLFTVFGVYDMISSIRFGSISKLRKFIEQFSKMNGVLDIKAHILLGTKLRENFYEIVDYHNKLNSKVKQ